MLKNKQKIAVLCDDRYHSSDVVYKGLLPLEDEGYVFEYFKDANLWTKEQMDKFSLVILAKANNTSATDSTPWMTDTMQKNFVNYVKQGNGLLVLHSGTVGYKDATRFNELIGGTFLHHPEQCPVTIDFISKHKISENLNSFTLKDEHYVIELNDNKSNIFMETLSENGGKQPGGWMRTHGKGRICVLTPGHNVDVLLHSSYQTLLKKVLCWINLKSGVL